MDNTVRYTPRRGNITISLTRKENSACVDVKHNGIGIPHEHLAQIFERFYRVDKSSSQNLRGAGLGLAISQNIAELHGGKIEVESQTRMGSTFMVILPLAGNS